MIHFPVAIQYDADGNPELAKIPIHKTWADMENLVKLGLAKSIGVSNFNVQALMDMLTYAEIRPAANEVELHPYNAQKSLVKFLHKYGILPVGYCPLSRSGKDQGIHVDETI